MKASELTPKKTVYLPAPNDIISVSEYRKVYGIDLTPYILIQEGYDAVEPNYGECAENAFFITRGVDSSFVEIMPALPASYCEMVNDDQEMAVGFVAVTTSILKPEYTPMEITLSFAGIKVYSESGVLKVAPVGVSKNL